MSRLDFDAIGFKAGLEIHQQLSGRKLFCACPAVLREDEPHFTVSRRLRASVGESGEVDVAAAAEQRKQKRFVYQAYRDTTCLVELDEEPVSQPDADALVTARMVSEMLGMTVADEVHVMRKVVVDGSNTSAFQRTMLVSLDGEMDVDGPVRVEQLCLEEDAAKVVSRGEEEDVYNLSRLGIPLLEITTAPDARDPEHLQRIAAHIGMVLRSTGRVKRGLGTIRQDVNVSVRKGSRVEIKGVQDLDLMPVIAENEARRQLALADLAEEHDGVSVGDVFDATDAFTGSQGWVAKAVARGDRVLGITVGLPDGVLGKELFAGYRVGTELAGYAKAWGFGGIIHSDEDASKYGLDDWSAVHDDAFILIVGGQSRGRELLTSALAPRIERLADGVPSEVRKANDDGTTTYLRPMPGASRMYPETDTRPFSLERFSAEIPALLSVRIPSLAEGFSVDAATLWQISRAGLLDVFEEWAPKVQPSLVADVLGTKQKELRKRHDVAVDVAGIAEEVFSRLEQGSISKDAIDDVLLAYAENGSVDWERFRPLDESSVRETIREVVADDPDAPFGALMGAAMQRLGGKVDGKTVSRLLKEELS